MDHIGQKILILGCPGSGKSTLAEKLHAITGIPLFHLDYIWWNADGTNILTDEFDEKLYQILQKDKWMIDGDYQRTVETRIRACDTVIFLDYPKDICMKGVMDRIGKKRSDLPWIEKKPDLELIDLIQRYNTDRRPAILSLLKKYDEKTFLIFRSREETDQWLRKRM